MCAGTSAHSRLIHTRPRHVVVQSVHHLRQKLQRTTSKPTVEAWVSDSDSESSDEEDLMA